MIHCMGCHQAHGEGMPPAVPAFSGDLGQLVARPDGRAYLVQVPGAAQSLLDDEALAAVINWMLARFSGSTIPASFADYTGEEVHQYRRHILSDPAKARRQILSEPVTETAPSLDKTALDEIARDKTALDKTAREKATTGKVTR